MIPTGLLVRVIEKVLGNIEGVCARCGSKEVGFIHDKETNTVKFACKNCGCTEIRDVVFTHAKKEFKVGFVKDVCVTPKQ